MTRKILALALALVPALAAARDLRPGTFELGGGTSLDIGKATTETGGLDVDVSSTTLSADALYYVVKGLGIGLGLSYDRTRTEGTLAISIPGFPTTTTRIDTKQTQLIVGPEAKLSLAVAQRVSVLVVGEAGYLSVDQDSTSRDGWAFLAGGGLRFFPADLVSLDALFEYSYASASSDTASDLTIKGWDVGLRLAFFFGGR